MDQQTDVYALGLVLYEILTAVKVYRFDSDIEALRTIPEREIAPVNQICSDVPEGLNRIIMKCLQKDKQLRYTDAKELNEDLVGLKACLQISYDESDLSNFMRKTFNHA